MSRKILALAAAIVLCPAVASAQIVITEIMYNPDSSESTSATQFVEIANVTNAAVDLTGWELGDSQDDDWNALPAITLQPKEILVVVGSSAADFNTAFAGIVDASAIVFSIQDDGGTMFNLSNSPSATNETVAVRDDTMTLIDEVNYDDSGDWPSDSPDGVSIYLNVTEMQLEMSGATLNDDGTNWLRAMDGTAGAGTSVAAGVWNSVEVAGPGNFNGNGFVPVELQSFSID
ncbi:MAG: lamin tail domain-containing protein [Acidobacteriota bacterium]